MFSSDSVHLQFDVQKPAPHRGWVKYFVAALGLGMGAVQAQEQKLLDYWWVMPREDVQNAPRVIRVIGAKGEKFEEVYAEEQTEALRGSAAIMQARLERQAALRLEAQQRARELREAGKSPAVAYEEAWAEVYSRRWLTADWRVGSSKLEDMLTRMASADADFALTEEEQQWVLEALLEDDDRLESAEGTELLRNLARRLRSMGYGKINVTAGVNDELMMRFADAMRHKDNSMSAYRDALFKTYRDRVMHHELRGYVAPWGMGLGGRNQYRQAPVVVTPSAGTASTQQPQLPGLTAITVGQSYTAPGLNDVPGAQSNFLATAPDAEEKEKEEEKEKDEEEPLMATSAPASPAAPAPRIMMARSMSLRSTGAGTLDAASPVAEIVADLDVTGKTALYFTSDGLTPNGGTTYTYREGRLTGSTSRYALTQSGSFTSAEWIPNNNGLSYWKSGDATPSFETSGLYKYHTVTWETNVGTDPLNLIDLSEGEELYLGGAGYKGTVRVVSTDTDDGDSAYLGYYSPSAAVYSMGKLAGDGVITLLTHGASNQASIYSFSDTETPYENLPWFSGTVKLGASQEGIMQLNLGAAGETTAWDGVVFDMTPSVGPGHTTEPGTDASKVKVILAIRNNATIAGLKGGSSTTSTVTNASRTVSYNLTIGEERDSVYEYGGTLGGDYYTGVAASESAAAHLNLIKKHSNTQIFTEDISANAAAVNEGVLQFDGKLTVGRALALPVEGEESSTRVLKAAELVTTMEHHATTAEPWEEIHVEGSGSLIQVSGNVTSADDMAVLNGGSLTAGGNLTVADVITVNSGTVSVSKETKTRHLSVYGEDASFTTTDLSKNLTAGVLHVEVGSIASPVTSGKPLLKVEGNMEADSIRLRSDATLVTAGTASINASAAANDGNYLYGGASWTMSGGDNVLNGHTYVMNLQGTDGITLSSGSDNSKNGEVVLTLPGIFDFADAGWTSDTQPVFHLDGVTLNIQNTVTFNNMGLSLADYVKTDAETERTILLSNGGWFVDKSGVVDADLTNDRAYLTLHDGTGMYHGEVKYDASGNIVLSVLHEIVEPYKVGAGSIMYLEMRENAPNPAIPYLAYDSAEYHTSTKLWADPTPVSNMELIKMHNLQVSEGAHIYLGEDDNTAETAGHRHLGSNINILTTTGSADDYVALHGPIDSWSAWYLDGQLGNAEQGTEGHLKLVAHHGIGTRNLNGTETEVSSTDTQTITSKTYEYGTASTFTFTNSATPESWLKGKVSLAANAGTGNANGGIVQLNIGNVNIANAGDTRWKDTEIDLSISTFNDLAAAHTTEGKSATEAVLGLVGNATIAGLTGGSGSYVVTNVPASSTYRTPVLTLGDAAGQDYTYAGTIGSGNFYTGGQATRVETTVDSSSTTAVDTNMVRMGEGRLNLVKVGANTQTFSGSVYLDQVLVKEGSLALTGGTIDIESMEVLSGANLQTASGAVMNSLTLHGDSTWEMMGDTNRYLSPLYLTNMSGGGANITSTDPLTWSPSRYMNLSGANLTLLEGNTLTAGGEAIFEIGSGITLNLNNPHVLTNVSGAAPNRWIAMFGKVSREYESLPTDMILVEDEMGNFYNAAYIQNGVTIYLQLGAARDYGIVVERPDAMDDEDTTTLKSYIWSGVDNGTTKDDVNHIGLTMGNVWRADGSAENTGWHEQRAAESTNDDIGVYKNGYTVSFADKNVHGDIVEKVGRNVILHGNVAPGKMYITAEESLGQNGADQAEMKYGYAFTVTEGGEGSITDLYDAAGNLVTRTSIDKTGDALLVMNSVNSFSGGIKVLDGGLYLAREGAAGTGTLTFHTNQKWTMYEKSVTASSSWWEEVERQGAELMVSYLHSNDNLSAYRNGLVPNDIVLTKVEGGEYDGSRFTISFGLASYNIATEGGENNHVNVPRHWRNFNFTGALAVDDPSTTDELVLTCYSSTYANFRDQSYVTSFTLSESTAGGEYITDANGNIINRFKGTVTLKNTINTSPLKSNVVDERTAGTGQVRLTGDKLSGALLDMTRETVTTSGENRQTYNNVLVLDGDAVSLRGLKADFQNKMWYYDPSNATKTWVTAEGGTMGQNDEVWHVRTVSSSNTTLYLGEASNTGDSQFVYSGSMGFSQSYADVSQGHVAFGDGMAANVTLMDGSSITWTDRNYDSIKNGGLHSMGVENGISLVKSSQSRQYIHTALLSDVSVYEGKLGFNNLQLTGNLNLVGGSALELGVVQDDPGSTGQNLHVVADTGWNYIAPGTTSKLYSAKDNGSVSYRVSPTSDTVTLGSGKTLTIYTPGETSLPTTAVVEGDVNMAQGSALTFLANQVLPDSNAADGITPYLDINGELQIANSSSSGLGVTLSGLNFDGVTIANRQSTFFYLAEADNIVVGGGDSSKFFSRIMSLGNGYFGVLDTLDNSAAADSTFKSPDEKDYLVIRVYDDARCTWSGKTSVTREAEYNDESYTPGTFAPGNVWTHKPETLPDNFDYRWKENSWFENGMAVLFGNLYEPDEWTPVSNLNSTQSSKVDRNLLQDGHPASDLVAKINGHLLEDKYEHVEIQGRVAPLAVIINPDYFNADGSTKYIDSTNYVFSGSEKGYIDNATESELLLWKAENDIENEIEDLENWNTSLTKRGTGTAIIQTDNRFTGGTEILGGRIVMQHVNALGAVYNTVDDDNPLFTGNDCTITLMNDGELMGDFSDSDFPGNHVDDAGSSAGGFMQTTTIHNHIVVNEYVDPGVSNIHSVVDGRILNRTEHKLVLDTLEGESDAVLELVGVGYTAEQSREKYGDADNMFRYGVFKVLDPRAYHGVVALSARQWQDENGNKRYTLENGGNVQLDIMSTAKSDAGADWTNATIDLSIRNKTDRTVLALDAMPSTETQICEIDGVMGTLGRDDEGNYLGTSSVLNMSASTPVTLQLLGKHDYTYEGVLGYGDFQVSVDYGGYTGQHGHTRHHYGEVGYGSLNVEKNGNATTQSVRRAWLNQLEVKEGVFHVSEALVANKIVAGTVGDKVTAKNNRVTVGQTGATNIHTLNVGAGGVLAMNTTIEEDPTKPKTDAWAGIGHGSYSTDSKPIAWVLLEDGAMLSAREDWYTRKSVDIASNAEVTINTHHFTIDPYVLSPECEETRYTDKRDMSHIIQLLGSMSGHNVTLNVNNWKTDPEQHDVYRDPATGELRYKEDSPYMGYAAINDINDFTGTSYVNVESMTSLQIFGDNGGSKSDVHVTIAGKNATMEITDMVITYDENNMLNAPTDTMKQFIKSVTFGGNQNTEVGEDPYLRENNGQLILGGTEVRQLMKQNSEYLTAPDTAAAKMIFSSRHNKKDQVGTISNLNVNLVGAAVIVGGESGTRSVMNSVHVDVTDPDVSNKIEYTTLDNSLVHLLEDCSVNLVDTVLLESDSVIRGVDVTYNGATVVGDVMKPLYTTPPAMADGMASTRTEAEVTTSVNTTVQLTFADKSATYTMDNGSGIMVLQADQLLSVDVTGRGLTLQLHEDMFTMAHHAGARFIAVMMGGNEGRFLYEEENTDFAQLLDSQYVLQDRDGEQMHGHWVTSTYVSDNVGTKVTPYMLYFEVPEPATTTLSLLALTALCARRRRK